MGLVQNAQCKVWAREQADFPNATAVGGSPQAFDAGRGVNAKRGDGYVGQKSGAAIARLYNINKATVSRIVAEYRIGNAREGRGA